MCGSVVVCVHKKVSMVRKLCVSLCKHCDGVCVTESCHSCSGGGPDDVDTS